MKQRFGAFSDLISFPPIATGYTNPDGTNLYKSRLQVFLVLPSIFVALFIIFAYVLPLFYNDPVGSRMMVHQLDFGIQIPSNDTT